MEIVFSGQRGKLAGELHPMVQKCVNLFFGLVALIQVQVQV